MKAQAPNCGGRDATWAQHGERRGAPPKLVLGTLNVKEKTKIVESGEVKGATRLLSLHTADKSAPAASADYVVGFAHAFLVGGLISSAQWAEVTNLTVNSGR